MTKPPFGFSQPYDSPGFALWQATITWQRLIKEALEPFHITHPQFVIMALTLWLESQKSTVTQADIIHLSRLDKMTVSKSLQNLAKRGLIERKEDPSDTRAKILIFTNRGRYLIHKMIPVVEQLDASYFGCLPKTQEKDLILLLNKLNQNS